MLRVLGQKYSLNSIGLKHASMQNEATGLMDPAGAEELAAFMMRVGIKAPPPHLAPKVSGSKATEGGACRSSVHKLRCTPDFQLHQASAKSHPITPLPPHPASDGMEARTSCPVQPAGGKAILENLCARPSTPAPGDARYTPMMHVRLPSARMSRLQGAGALQRSSAREVDACVARVDAQQAHTRDLFAAVRAGAARVNELSKAPAAGHDF